MHKVNTQRRGIILAGGNGTRLYPITKAVSKQLIPVYSKPMIYYSLSVLLLSRIRDILLISQPDQIDGFKKLFGDGSKWGINIEYCVQPKPEGIAQAFILGEEFIKDSPCALVLGDNIFYGNGVVKSLLTATNNIDKSTILCYHVPDPERYGCIELGKNNKIISIEEKPEKPKSNYCVTGVYFYPNSVVEVAKNLKPSKRGELEITDVNNWYIENGLMEAKLLKRGDCWFDTGTIESMVEATEFVRAVEKRQGYMIGSPEEICYKNGWIQKQELHALAIEYNNTPYGKYLLQL